MEFAELFKPIKLGNVEIKNRIGGACTTTGGADINGYIQEQCLASYAARAKGGAGFVVIECTFASDFGAETSSFGNPRISNRSYWAGLSELAETIKAFGAKAFIQISPGFGRQGSGRLSGKTPGAPSAIRSERPNDYDERVMPFGYETREAQYGSTTVPRMLTIEEIQWMENQFPDAVAAARICGFDAVELHSPHGYLIHQFLSPRSNKRNDIYGGSLENRTRFLKNLMINTRKRVGRDYCLGIRLSGDEHMSEGIHEDEMLIVAREMEKLDIDYLSVSDGSYEARSYFFPQDPSCMIRHAAAFKSALNIPVLVPSVHDPYLAEQVIREGKADGVLLGRQLIADPDWPRKVQEGKVDEIIRCVKCNVCLSRFNRGLQMRCPLNPIIGRERYMPEYQRPPARVKQPPCEAACPAGVDVQNHIIMVSRGQFDEALYRIRKTIPLPGVVGRVCTRPCEANCDRAEMDESIAINALKRYVADYELDVGPKDITPAPRTKEESIAVIGSGPAGLTTANDLVKEGYGVTIFEALPTPGGMLAVGIPEYRLPKRILQTEIEAIKKLGVEMKLNSPVGKNGLTLAKLRQQGYKAIFIAVGAHNSTKLDIPGEDMEGVYHGVTFLRDVNRGKKAKVGEKVVIVGGGNVAVDAARTALRLGSGEVSLVYRRSRQEMPADEKEIAEAEKEGVKINYLAAPAKILGKDGKVSGMECIRMKLGKAGADGRRRSISVEGSEFIVEADMIIAAIGEVPDLSLLPKGSEFRTSPTGTLVVDNRSLSTGMPGVFAGGDAVLGPATVIEAIAQGKKAAVAIDRYLQGESLPPEEEPPPIVAMNEITFHIRELEKESRIVMPALSLEKRAKNFDEVNLGLTKEEAIKEARRCLTCRICAMPY